MPVPASRILGSQRGRGHLSRWPLVTVPPGACSSFQRFPLASRRSPAVPPASGSSVTSPSPHRFGHSHAGRAVESQRLRPPLLFSPFGVDVPSPITTAWRRPTTCGNVHYRRSLASQSQKTSDDYYKLRPPTRAALENPFVVLGLDPPATSVVPAASTPRNTTTTTLAGETNDSPSSVVGLDDDNQHHVPVVLMYADVKRRFLQIALAHHPDTTTATTAEDQAAHRDHFIRARQAFERIVAHPTDGRAVLASELLDHDHADHEPAWDDASLADWFRRESGGHDLPFMDLATMKEVAKMTETLHTGPGLDRDGGMWTLAAMVTNSVKQGGNGLSDILRLESGTVRDRDIDGLLRRKRRR